MLNAIQFFGWASAILCVVGCGSSAPDSASPATLPVDAVSTHVTFHVPQMCERLKLL